MLSKWLFKLINEDGLWQRLIRRKYLRNQTIGQGVKKPGDSQFWSGLKKIKERFLSLVTFVINNGEHTRFWEDKWLGNFTLQQRYPSLYNIVRRKNATIATVFSTTPLNVSFRRGLVDLNLDRWHNLVASIAHVRLNNMTDMFRWSLHQNAMFTVHSMYAILISNGNVRHDNVLWKLKLSLKNQNFHVVSKKRCSVNKRQSH